MRTLKASQKGKGWLGNRFKNFRRFITGRRRKMKTREDLPATFKIASKKSNKRELPSALEKRPKIQKALNKLLYKKGELKSVPSPKQLNNTILQITGNGNLPQPLINQFLNSKNYNEIGMAEMPFKSIQDKTVSKNKRDKLNLREAKIPDENLPEPPPTPYRPTRNPVGNVDNKETQIQAQVRVLPIFYAIYQELLNAQDVLTNDYATVIESLEDNNIATHIQDIPEANLRAFLTRVKEVYEAAHRNYPSQTFENYYEPQELASRYGPNRPALRNRDIVRGEFTEGARQEEIQRNNAITQALFHAPFDVMQEVLYRLEFAGPTRREQYVVNTQDRLVNGQFVPVRKIAVAGAGSFDRYMGFLLGGLDYIQITYEHDSQRCFTPIPFRIEMPSEIQGNQNPRGIYRPLVTLKSNDCLTMFNGIKNFLIHSTTQIDSESFAGNWIVLRKDYFPLKGADEGGGGGPFDLLLAKAFPHASYIQKALNDWAIDGIDSALYTLFDIKYPFYSMKISTYMTTPERFLRLKATIERERSDYPVGQGQFEYVNFMMIDKSILKENTTFLAHFNPFEGTTKVNDLMSKAINEQAIYGVSPYIAYFMKRKYLSKYFDAFKTPNTDRTSDPLSILLRVYTRLPTEQEKITFDYLQYLFYLETLQEILTQPFNNNQSRENQLQRRLQQLQSIYRQPITQARSIQMLLLATAERLPALENLQTMVDSRPSNTTQEFFRSILRKFVTVATQGVNENAFQRGRLGIATRAVNRRRADRNAVQAQINALEQEKNTLGKAWNPFQRKTRKQRLNQIERNLEGLRQNLQQKEYLYSMTQEQLAANENALLRSPVLVSAPRRATVRRSLGPAINPFN